MRQVGPQVISNREVMPNVRLIWLEASQIASEARPGQYVMVGCGGNTVLPRPLSIHQSHGDRIALLFRVVGKGTAWLSGCRVGDSLSVFGPLGKGFSPSPKSKDLLLVAGGIGIAPLRFLAEEAVAQGRKVTLLWGASSAKDLLPALTDGLLPRVQIEKITEDESGDYRGLVTDIIVNHIDWADQIFACGPLPMYRAMSRMPELKAKPVQVSLEVVMGCGRGVCYGCTIKTKSGLKKVCEDGPVFNMDDILWDELE